MPRVSQEHLDARRRQIVEAAWRCFSRQGFHRTSMQDVISESGLSAGAVYRYFRSKDELIHVVASEALSGAVSTLEEILAAPEPMAPGAAVGLLLERVLDFTVRPDLDLTRVGVTAWAEALRDEQLHAVAGAAYDNLRRSLTEVVRRWRDAGNLPADLDLEACGAVIFSVVPGFLLQRLLLGVVDARSYGDALETLMGTTPSRPSGDHHSDHRPHPVHSSGAGITPPDPPDIHTTAELSTEISTGRPQGEARNRATGPGGQVTGPGDRMTG